MQRLLRPPIRSSHSSCNLNTNCESPELAPKVVQSFTGSVEELMSSGNLPLEQKIYNAAMDDNRTSVNDLSPSATDVRSKHEFRTREQDSMKLYVTGPEILNFQGNQYSADDIAPIWKKDCRMWLWKSVRNARKKRKQLAECD